MICISRQDWLGLISYCIRLIVKSIMAYELLYRWYVFLRLINWRNIYHDRLDIKWNFRLTKHVVVIGFLTLIFFWLSNSFGITQNMFCNNTKKQSESMSWVTQNKYRGKRPCDTLSKTMKLPCRYSTVH